MSERVNSGPAADGRQQPRPTEQVIRSRIGRAVSRAKLAGLWESLWPRVLPFLGVVAVFLIVSWFGLWRLLPEVARWAVLAAFGLAALAALLPPVRVRMPDRAAALIRVERATGAPHRPAPTFNDRLASDQDDPGTRALWIAHRERLLAGFGRLRAGSPSPGVPRRDPLAFRFLAVLLLAVGFLFADGERTDRIAEAFRGPPLVAVAEAAANARVDAWANPPKYTDRPPIFLTGEAIRTNSVITVPAGTTVFVRISGSGADRLDVFSATSLGEAEVLPGEATATMPPNQPRDGSRPLERQVLLDDQATITVREGNDTLNSWQFAVVPDTPPAIMPNAEAARAGSGALQLAYHVTDDYGVVSAEARIERQDSSDPDARPLFEAPSFPLALPRLRVRDGDGETIRDLTSHPWAGSHVKLTMVAKDELDQQGVSEPLLFVLPARVFTNPISKALVEQRRLLAMDAGRALDVANVLDILTIEPDKFLPTKGAFLALRTAYYRTVNARNDDDLRGVVDFLWEVAVGLEDGNLSNAANNLRDAQEALRQALQRGASPEEIQKLMDQLRQAMQEYMQALAEQQQQSGQQQQMSQNDSNMQEVGPDQLQQMMDQIQQLAENGSFEAAQELLNQLQQMMENMQTAQQTQGGQQQQGQSPMGQALEQLGEMIQRQQQLMDETFSFNQNQNQPGMGQLSEQEVEEFMRSQREGMPGQQHLGRQSPMTEEEIQEALRRYREGRQQRGEQLGELQEGQQELQESLQALMDQLGEMGMEPNEALGQADQAMNQAQGQLRDGQPGRALNPQGQALDQLRAGAQDMAEQMAQQQGEQQGQEGMRQSQAGGREDPLGRQMRNRGPDFGTRVKVPDEIDVQRAREILETIRRRLDDMSRPVIERNYLERLLDLY